FGGPDFAVEIMSPHDRSREKFGFYAKVGVGVRELLLVDRRPWQLELYRRDQGRWDLVGQSGLDPTANALRSLVLPLTYRLILGPRWPRIEVGRAESRRKRPL